MPTQKFFVRGLEHEDEARIAERVRSLEGVLFAVANHEDQCLEVEFEDDAITPAEIASEVAEMGFPAEPAG